MAVTISGTGCSLVDYLYTDVSFESEAFKRYRSLSEGDGGLVPGKLVFASELEEFAGVGFQRILRDVVGDRGPDATNLGGPSIVALIHAAQLAAGSDVSVRFYGVRGDDPSGRAIADIVSHTPVDISGYKTASGRTPFTNVFSDPTYDNGHGERTFVNALGVAAEYGPEQLDDSFYDADVLVFGGTALVPRIHDSLTPLLERGKRAGALTVVNTVYDFRAEKRNPTAPWPLGDTEKSLPLIDLLVTDREEALRISGESDAERAIAALSDGGAHSCVVTQGSDDVLVVSDGTVFDSVRLRPLPVSEAVRSEILSNPERAGDTTGCGDNFAGGLLASIAMQREAGVDGRLDLLDACSWAIASGGYACFYVGGTYLENSLGEKRSNIVPYYDAYCEQIR
jgi:sugar/nucleoside kinase (ribokinase family)